VDDRRRRLFVAVELAEPVVEAAGRLIDRLRTRVAVLAPRARIMWVAPGRLHITLRFIGDVPAAQADGILEGLARPMAVPPFDVSFGGLGVFPPRGAPRVIWAGIGRGVDGLRAVAGEVETRLRPLGIPGEARALTPHLTLARVRAPEGLRAVTVCDGLDDTALGGQRVEAITLMESRLSPGGSTYLGLQQTPLLGR
jgi:RNA 2',3'-cyclic 3'-phosphodiesterase